MKKIVIDCFYAALPRPLDIFKFTCKLEKNNITYDSLLRIAKKNKLHAVISESFILAGYKCESIISNFKKYELRTNALIIEINAFIECVNKANIPVIFLENGGLLLQEIVPSALFEFSDIDVLVKRKDFETFLTNMQTFSYFFESNISAVKPEIGERIILKRKGEKLRINVQSTLVAHEFVTPAEFKEIEQLFENCLKVRPPNIGVLNTEDFLIQLCIHSKSHSLIKKPGVQLQTDIDWFVRNRTIDWNKIVEMVERYRLKQCCYFALATPLRILNTPIPVHVLDRIKPNGLSVLIWEIFVLPNVIFQNRTINMFAAAIALIIMNERTADTFKILFPEKNWLLRKYGGTVPLVIHYFRIIKSIFGK